MARLSEQQIDEVRGKADIVEVISQYLPVERKGRNYRCMCPFHDDHDPSMTISQEKQIFKCFVCGAGGNVFSFVQKYENFSFQEAVFKVAQLVHVEMDQNIVLEKKTIDPSIQVLYRICQETIEFTSYQLQTPAASKVKEYLLQRGIEESIMESFQIGYNPKEDVLYRFLHAKKYQDEDILESGVVRLQAQGIADVFGNRITIPIHDVHGNPVGFTARRIEENNEPKYINTSETKVYRKGDLVFNYHRAKNEVQKEKCVYLVEGAMDVIALAKLSKYNAVAMLGTACTTEQLKQLAMLRTNVVVCYDGDTAGKNATYKFGKIARGKVNFTIVDNRLGLDPDEIIETYGKDELAHLLHKTISWIEFLFQFLLTRYDLENYSEKKQFAMEMAEEIKLLKDEFERQNSYHRLKELTGFDMQIVLQEETRQVHKKTQRHAVQRSFLSFPKSGSEAAEFEILSQMLCGVSANNIFKDELGFLKSENGNRLAMYIIDYYRTHQEIQVAELYDLVEEEKVKELLLSVAHWELASKTVQIDVLKEAIVKLKSCILDERIERLKQQASQLQDPIKKAVLAQERNQLIRERNALWNNDSKQE